MQEATEIHTKLTTDEKEKDRFQLKDIFQLIYHSSLLGGVILSILYFTFSAETFPSIGNISQLASYIIAVFAVAILFIFILAITLASPFFFILSQNLDHHQKIILMWSYSIITLSSFLTVASLYYFDSKKSFWILLGLILLLMIPKRLLQNKDQPKIPLYHFQSTISYLKIDWTISFVFYLFISLFFLSSFIVRNHNLDKNTVVIALFGFLLIVWFINVYLIKNNEIINNPNKNFKKTIQSIGIILFIFIFGISMIFIYLKKPNPIVIVPFSQLKLGHYTAELHFKDDFINKANPFSLNETKQTSNTFFILSSIGDEYILRETRNTIGYNGSQNNHNDLFPFDYNGTRYYCEDDNQSLIWKISDTNKIHIQKVTNRTYDFNETVQKQLEYWKIIDKKTYRIKKENIEFEVIGKEINTQSTVWEHNAKN